MSYQLSEEEISYLKSSSAVPDEIRQYVARRHESIGTSTVAYMKVAAEAGAAADAIHAVRRLNAAMGEAVTVEDWRKRAISAESQAKALETAGIEKDRRMEQLLAKDSMAVHSED